MEDKLIDVYEIKGSFFVRILDPIRWENADFEWSRKEVEEIIETLKKALEVSKDA